MYNKACVRIKALKRMGPSMNYFHIVGQLISFCKKLKRFHHRDSKLFFVVGKEVMLMANPNENE